MQHTRISHRPSFESLGKLIGERVMETRARFFDGWFLVGILLIQVNAKGPGEEEQWAWVE